MLFAIVCFSHQRHKEFQLKYLRNFPWDKERKFADHSFSFGLCKVIVSFTFSELQMPSFLRAVPVMLITWIISLNYAISQYLLISMFQRYYFSSPPAHDIKSCVLTSFLLYYDSLVKSCTICLHDCLILAINYRIQWDPS